MLDLAASDRPFVPGDLLAFAGQGFESRLIAIMSCRAWQLLRGQWFSHIGICARGPAGNLLLFESTTLADTPCEILHRTTHGTQAHDPRRRIDDYAGKVWRLRLADREALSEPEENRLADFLLSEIGKPYDYTGAFVAGTWRLRACRWFCPRLDTLFCSDLVLAALKDIHKVDHGLNPRTYSPGRTVRDLTYWGLYQPLDACGSESRRIR
ncbi:MAG TPA: hypothetical protein VGX78_21205 [Pirellulales bacterium]|jgi:hypothetical protein|nr:hypothetical protein [Pirellulales bacterium]